MEYIIAIPTYRRATVCRDKTLATLQRNGIPKELIFVFVVEDEYDLYKDTLNPETYGKLVVGYKGLITQREYIESFFQDGQLIVSMDDDIEHIDLTMMGNPNPTLNEFIHIAFRDCMDKGSYIWGVYPVYNPFFRKTTKPLITHRSFIIGSMYGYINREDNIRVCLTTNKDDVERSIRYFEKDGIVLRYNKVGVKTRMYAKGGLGLLSERKACMEADALALNKTYPDITRVKIRKNGIYEVVLKSR
jgi:hypothetical protein